jgi:hypothetical protein
MHLSSRVNAVDDDSMGKEVARIGGRSPATNPRASTYPTAVAAPPSPSGIVDAFRAKRAVYYRWDSASPPSGRLGVRRSERSANYCTMNCTIGEAPGGS